MNSIDYKKLIIKPITEACINNHGLLYSVAVLLAKTEFYANAIRITNPDQDPFEIIIKKYILPNSDNINIVLYDNELVGFYFAHLIQDLVPKGLNTIPSIEKINWNNLGNVIDNFYDVFFKNNEFTIDNMAFEDKFQKKGIYSNIIYPVLLNKAKKLNATNIVLAVFKYQNCNAYNLYLKRGFKPIANLKFHLEQITISPNNIIEKTSEELVLLRLPIDYT